MWWTWGVAFATEWTVGPDDEADFEDLGVAVATALPGDTLRLRGVVFPVAPLFLDGLHVIGAEGTELVPANEPDDTSDPPAVLTLRGHASLTGLAVRAGGVMQGVRVEDGQADFTDVELCGGHAQDGGNLEVEEGASVTVMGGRICEGSAFFQGGGMHVRGDATVSGTRFDDNVASSGGGLSVDYSGDLVLEDAVFEGNRNHGLLASGAALFLRGPDARIARTSFVDNVGDSSVMDVQTVISAEDLLFVGNRGGVESPDGSAADGASALRLLGSPAFLPSVLRRLRFCGNGSEFGVPAVRIQDVPVEMSNVGLHGAQDRIDVTGSLDLSFATWSGQVDDAGGALRLIGSGTARVAHGLLHDVTDVPFASEDTGPVEIVDSATSGSTPAIEGVARVDGDATDHSGCAWWVPDVLAVRNAFPGEPDVDGSPGSYGAIGGPFGPAVFPDGDADGWSDDREAAEGTDPAEPDTDGDGVIDGEDPAPLRDDRPDPTPPEARYGLGCRAVTGSGWLALLGLGFIRRRAANRWS